MLMSPKLQLTFFSLIWAVYFLIYSYLFAQRGFFLKRKALGFAATGCFITLSFGSLLIDFNGLNTRRIRNILTILFTEADMFLSWL